MPDWLKLSSEHRSTVEIPWETSFQIAKEKSQAVGKPILMWFTGSDWCSWCIKLDREVFQTSEFKQWCDREVIPLMLDYPQSTAQTPEITSQNQLLKQQFGQHIKGYPTVIIADANGHIFGTLGYVPGGPKKWIAAAESAMREQSAIAIP